MSRATILGVFAMMGCGGFGASLSVAEPGLREEGGAEEAEDGREAEDGEERDGEAEDEAGLEACADLLVQCLALGVSDDTALLAFDECLGANVRDGEGDEDRDGDEEREGDEEGEGDGEGDTDPERPA
jgi:hypothetical protein